MICYGLRVQKKQMPFRLPPELMNRIDKAAEYCGQTRQAFVQTAVLAEVAIVEERRRMKQLSVAHSLHGPLTQQDSGSVSAPTSSLVDALRQQRRETEPAPPPSAAQGQVVVNVGGHGSAHNIDAIDRLAAYVAAGNDFDRDARLRSAVDILRVTTTPEEERKVLAARLDEAVATKVKTNESGIMKTARTAFDKIAGIFGGGE